MQKKKLQFPANLSPEELQNEAEEFYHHCPRDVKGVFGYGSLIWKADIDFDNRYISQIHGYHRALGLWSGHYRGSHENPGLVLGLARGGSLYGVSYLARDEQIRRKMIIDVYKREMITRAYKPAMIMTRHFSGGKSWQQQTLTFVLDPAHAQYAVGIALDQQVKIIKSAHGHGGSNRDYVLATYAHLQQENIPCTMLAKICRLL